MVEVVNIDSDDETDNNAHYLALMAFVQQQIPAQSHPLLLPVITNLYDVKSRCPNSYLNSSKFRHHIDACRDGLNKRNASGKLHAFAQAMLAHCGASQSDQQPSKRRRLQPPRVENMGEAIKRTTASVICSRESSPSANSSTLPTTSKRIPVQTISQPGNAASSIALQNLDHLENIVSNLKKIQTTFSGEADVNEIMRIFIEHMISLKLERTKVSVSAIETYCSMLSYVKSSLQLLFHLRRLLLMKYFMEKNPVQIKPNDWFAAHYQIIPYHLSEYAMFAIFKRYLAIVLPPGRLKMVDLFQQRFKSALHGTKRHVLDRISKITFKEQEKHLKDKTYATTILCCLGDCMEIFIKSKAPLTSVKNTSRESSPVVIDLVSEKTSESSPKTSVSVQNDQRALSPSSSNVSSPLIDQEIIAFPTNIDASDHSEKSDCGENSSESAAVSSEVIGEDAAVGKPANSDGRESEGRETVQEGESGVESAVNVPEKEIEETAEKMDDNCADADIPESTEKELSKSISIVNDEKFNDTKIPSFCNNNDQQSDQCSDAEILNPDGVQQVDNRTTEILKSDGIEQTESSNFEILKSDSVETVQSSKSEILKSDSVETVQSSKSELLKSDGVETVQSSKSELLKSDGVETVESRNAEILKSDSVENVGIPKSSSVEDVDNAPSNKDLASHSVEMVDVQDSVSSSVVEIAGDQITNSSELSESPEFKNVIEQKKTDSPTSDPLEVLSLVTLVGSVESAVGSSEIKMCENNAAYDTEQQDAKVVAQEQESSEQPTLPFDVDPTEEKTVDDIATDVAKDDMEISYSNSLADKEYESHEELEIYDERPDRESTITLSQKSVEFLEETSRDCMITSVKPGNVQYVEIKLGKELKAPKNCHQAMETETLIESNDSDDMVKGSALETCDKPSDVSPPKSPKRLSLVSLESSKPDNDTPDSGTKRLSLKPALSAVPEIKIPACFKLDPQPSTSVITLDTDSEDDLPKEETESEDDPEVDEETEEYKQKVEQIEKLSRKLVRLARRIKAVQEADLDCEEMDMWGNLYLQESKLKKKHRTVLRKLEEIQGEMNVHYCFNVKVNCGIPVLSQYIEDRLNARQKFPDIQDVRRLIERGLKECKISMKENKLKSLAKQVFLDVGSQIQNHRKTELKLDGGFHLMDQVDMTKDPAKEDAELRKKLKRNKKLAQRDLRNIQSAFDAKQLERELLDNDIFDNEASGEEKSKEDETEKGKEEGGKSENSQEDEESESESENSEEDKSGSEGSDKSDDSEGDVENDGD